MKRSRWHRTHRQMIQLPRFGTTNANWPTMMSLYDDRWLLNICQPHLPRIAFGVSSIHKLRLYLFTLMQRTKEIFIYFYLLFISFGNRRARCAMPLRTDSYAKCYLLTYIFIPIYALCARAREYISIYYLFSFRFFRCSSNVWFWGMAACWTVEYSKLCSVRCSTYDESNIHMYGKLWQFLIYLFQLILQCLFFHPFCACPNIFIHLQRKKK